MGAMSQLAAEKEEALNTARLDWQEAYCRLMEYQDAYPPAHRKPEEIAEEARLSGVCTIMKSHYDNAKSRQYKL